jgi:UDP-N-acetylglucosamine 2-epimerase
LPGRIATFLPPPILAEILVHTGQHYDFNMSEIFFQELDLPQPAYFLGIGSGEHGEQTGRMLIEIEKVLLTEKPSLALVYGDTNTTLAGALAASKLHVPVAHVEAGLRSYNRFMPEEINRILTDHLSDILFCPSNAAVRNLEKEGLTNIINDGRLVDYGSSHCVFPARRSLPVVVNVGDVMFDIALETEKTVDARRILSDFNLESHMFILATIHRAENTDDDKKLKNIWKALNQIATEARMPLVFPAHPRVRRALNRFGLLSWQAATVQLLEPVSYREMLVLERNARLIITDSGGVQKEAYFMRTPCVIPRSESEWVELVDSGWATLAGTETGILVDVALNKLDSQESLDWKPYYGDGHACDKIVGILKEVIARSA